MIKFIEVVNKTKGSRAGSFTLGEVWINEDYVVSIREAVEYNSLLEEGLLPPDLESTHSFTSLTTNNGHLSETHVIVGSPSAVANRLSQDTKTLLKG